MAPKLQLARPNPKSLLNTRLLEQARFGGLFCVVFNSVSVNNFTMFTTDSLEIKVRLILLELLMVLHRNGIKEVSCGALMRVMGDQRKKLPNLTTKILLLITKSLRS